MATDEATPIGLVVGRALRGLRATRGITQEETARIIRAAGYDWTRTQIASLEAGRRADIGVGELIILSAVFGSIEPDWLAWEGPVLLGGRAVCDGASLGRWVAGAPALQAPQIEDPAAMRDAADLWVTDRLVPSEAETHAAKRLGITGRGVHRIATQLWEGRGLDEERARRLAAQAQPATAAYRGHVTRELLAELRAAPGLAKEERG